MLERQGAQPGETVFAELNPGPNALEGGEPDEGVPPEEATPIPKVKGG